jgi:hypothetical protein
MFKNLVNGTFYLRFMVDKILYIIDQKNKKKIKELKNCFKGKPIVVVGNGPSLNYTPLERIKYPCIGMNKINLIFKRTDWRPWCIIAANGLVVNQNKDFFNKTDINLFLPTKAKYLGIRNRENVIFNYETKREEFIEDTEKGFGAGYTVTYSALQLAYYLGANPVYLIGVDHSFKYEGKANDIKIHEGDDLNHFDPDYFKGQLWGLPDLDSSEKAYLLADKMFKKDGRKIFDATINGKLENFKKIINEILE